MNVIIDYDTGNVGSLQNMLKKIGAESIVTKNKNEIRKAKRLFLPGVGAFDTGMRNLASNDLIRTLEEKVLEDKTPILGICLGLQLMTKGSEEGSIQGLGWLDAETVALRKLAGNQQLKVPHMGWNYVEGGSHPLTNGFEERPRFYFVHTYGVAPQSCQEHVVFTTHYGCEFVSCCAKGNIVGMQFHPEKSHKFGMRIIKNFLDSYPK